MKNRIINLTKKAQQTIFLSHPFTPLINNNWNKIASLFLFKEKEV